MHARTLALGGALLLLLVTLSGCGASGRLLALRASPTPTWTPTPTATPTATPSPTPTPTATPTATPTPQPPSLELSLRPDGGAQGQTLLLRARLDRAAELGGVFDGRELVFYYDSPLEAWALIPIPVWSPIGERDLRVEAVTPEGQRVDVRRGILVSESPFESQVIDVPAEQGGLLAPGLRPAETLYLTDRLTGGPERPSWSGPFVVPAAGVRTSPFGARRIYNSGEPTAYHGGLDIAAPEGSPIVAAAPGTVVLAEPLYVRGNVVVIDHGAEVYTLYFHLSELVVEVGQTVAQGEEIGRMGSTGLSTGPHLHWELRVGEIFVDPEPWLTEDILTR